MRLHEITDDTPMTMLIIDGLLKKGRKVYWGNKGKSIASISTGPFGTTMTFNYPKPVATKQVYTIPHAKIDQWELVPEDGDFRLKMRDASDLRDVSVTEGKDDDAPMLVRLVSQRIAKGEEVGIDLHVGSAAGGRMRFRHVGDMISIELKHGVSKDVQRLTGGNENGIYIVYRKRIKPTTIVLDPTTFDDLYTLKQFDPANKEYGWVLTDAVEEGKRHYAID
jgi:hypothetical protein